jgi:hypothetical protein
VNIYLGLGLPWVIAATYYTIVGEKFIVPSGDLGYSVAVFLISAVVAIALLVVRRMVPLFGGELGGNRVLAWLSSLLLVGIWINYLILSGLRAYENE